MLHTEWETFACDTVDHDIRLDKLDHFGINKIDLNMLHTEWETFAFDTVDHDILLD